MGILKMLLPPASPFKILIVHIQEQIRGRPIYETFVGFLSGGNAMRGSWVSPSRHDECMDNMRVSFKISWLQSISMVVISKKYSFISLLLHFN